MIVALPFFYSAIADDSLCISWFQVWLQN